MEKNKRNRIIRISLKTLLWVVGVLLTLILLSSLLVYIFQDKIEQMLISRINKNLTAKIEVKDIHLTVWRNFPYVSAVFEDVKAVDTLSASRKPLLDMKEFVMEFNVWNIISGDYSIRHVSAENGEINLVKFANGKDNFHVWKKDTAKAAASEDVSINLKRIRLKNVQFRYLDYAAGQYYSMCFYQSVWKGKFDSDEYDLYGSGRLRGDSLMISGVNYLGRKDADFKVNGYVNNAISNIKIRDAELQLGDIVLKSEGEIGYSDQKPLINLSGGFKDESLEKLLSLLPEKQKHFFEGFTQNGKLNLSFLLHGDYSAKGTISLKSDFSISDGKFEQKKNGIALEQIKTKGNLIFSDIRNPSTLRLDITNFSAVFDGKNIAGSVKLNNALTPEIVLNAKGEISLEKLHYWMNVKEIRTMSGALAFDIHFEGKLPSWKGLKAKDFIGNKSSGTLKITNAAIQSEWVMKPVEGLTLDANFNNNDLVVNDLKFKYGKSDISLNGDFDNFIPYLFLPSENIRIHAKLKSGLLALDEILVREETKNVTGKSSSNQIFINNINADLELDVQQVVFGKFEARQCQANVYYSGRRLAAEDVIMKTLGGSITGKAILSESDDSLLFQASTKFKNIDIREAFISFDNFGQKSMTQDNLRGRTTAEIQIFGKLSRDYQMSLNGLKATLDITVDDGEIMNYEPLIGLKDYIKGRDFSKISFETLKNNINIDDGKISIPQMEIRSNAINLKVSGWHTFENEIEYHLQVRMKELRKKAEKPGAEDEYGYVDYSQDGGGTLFLLITGTVDKPDYKQLDKAAMKEKINSDIKKEKENMKTILNKEFGLFKKDSTLKKDKPDPNSNKKIKVEWEDE